MKKIIILCPGNIITGGVNSLHNLCASLKKNRFEAYMHYFDKDSKVLNSQEILSYNVNHHNGELDLPNHLIIVSETSVLRLLNFKNATKIIYWLSLNFFFKSPDWSPPFNIKIFRKLISCRNYYGYSDGIMELTKRKLNEYAKRHVNIWTDDFIHISNSYFVANYCINKGARNTFVLHNPIRAEFYNNEIDPNKREKTILFGPKTSKLLIAFARFMLKGYKVIQLRNITLNKVFQLMSKGLVFAEFGNNPGRDRMPREAAILGCVLFINTRGSFALKDDYLVDNQYKINDGIFRYPLIIKRIKDAAENYKLHFQNFAPFRKQLEGENLNFNSEVKVIFRKLIENKIT